MWQKWQKKPRGEFGLICHGLPKMALGGFFCHFRHDQLINDKIHYRYICDRRAEGIAVPEVVIANGEGNPSQRMFPMFDDNTCPLCGLPYQAVEWFEDLSGIGDDFTDLVSFQDDDELCACMAEDEDD